MEPYFPFSHGRFPPTPVPRIPLALGAPSPERLDASATKVPPQRDNIADSLGRSSLPDRVHAAACRCRRGAVHQLQVVAVERKLVAILTLPRTDFTLLLTWVMSYSEAKLLDDAGARRGWLQVRSRVKISAEKMREWLLTFTQLLCRRPTSSSASVPYVLLALWPRRERWCGNSTRGASLSIRLNRLFLFLFLSPPAPPAPPCPPPDFAAISFLFVHPPTHTHTPFPWVCCEEARSRYEEPCSPYEELC